MQGWPINCLSNMWWQWWALWTKSASQFYIFTLIGHSLTASLKSELAMLEVLCSSGLNHSRFCLGPIIIPLGFLESSNLILKTASTENRWRVYLKKKKKNPDRNRHPLLDFLCLLLFYFQVQTSTLMQTLFMVSYSNSTEAISWGS